MLVTNVQTAKRVKPAAELLKAQVKADFNTLRNNPDCTFGDIGSWFEHNGNRLSRVFAGRAGRKLGSFQLSTLWGVSENEDQQPILGVYGRWDFSSQHGEPPDGQVIAQHIPVYAMRVQQFGTLDTCMWATLEFNLNEWPQLAPQAMLYFLDKYISDGRTPSALESDKHNITTLLRVAYPKLSFDILMSVVELGLLDIGEAAAISWLKRQNEQTPNTSISELDMVNF